MYAVILIGVFGLGVLAFVGVVVRGVVNRIRGQDNGEWEDAPAAGEPPQMRPGPGWGNGGSWN
ncbi:hypothetical protein [Nostocoides sp. HKS02]|uniref:hypothetical protein n=1 Tax=Nostocoides sp. HKS02 TaxID=1813880 RepID=UPI0018A82785|nr:hypothetical protein [Tetrasphaera sp. HKS02]